MSAQIVPRNFLLNEWAKEAIAGAQQSHSGGYGDHHLRKYILPDKTYQEAVQSVDGADVYLALQSEAGEWLLESLWAGKPMPKSQMVTN